MNSTLRLFLRATDDAERARLLEELILGEAAPLVRRTISYRLRFCFGTTRDGPTHPDAEDLYHDIIAKLVARLEVLRAQIDPVGIRDFGQYAMRVAANTCSDYLRLKYPARARLKDRLRDLLDRHPDFALWRRDSDDEFICGFTVWRDLSPSRSSADRVRRLETEPTSADPRLVQARRMALSRFVAELFNWVGGPMEFDALVSVAASLLEVKGQVVVPFDEEEQHLQLRMAEPVLPCETRIEMREVLTEIWDAVCVLPEKHRAAFFFGFADANGDDLMSLLLAAEVTTAVEIAARLGISLEKLMTVWKQMPLDNGTLAVLLGTTRQQVSKWRYRAHRRLEEQLLHARARK